MRKNSTYGVVKVRRSSTGGWLSDQRADTVAGEEPLEIRVGGQTITTTMRTPGHDVELAHGFLFSEGHIRTATDVHEARYCQGTDAQGLNTYNLLDMDLGSHHLDITDIRLTTTTSACGVCGTSSIDKLRTALPYSLQALPIDPELIVALPQKLREQQKEFKRTGGIHAAGAFDATGTLLVAREDVGRHNAADKVIGHLLMNGQLPAQDKILVMSSRASYELVHKAAMAGFGMLVAVSAASSLAVDTARELGIALVGFTREDRFNIYSGSLA